MDPKPSRQRNTDNDWTSNALGRRDVAAVMRRVMDDPTYLTSRDFVGDTPLLTAIGYCDAALVEFMLRQGADPNAKVDDGYTALLSAIESKKPESVQIVSQLIAAGADIHAKGINGWTPLHMAAAHGHLEKVRLLIDAGARVNERKLIDAEETPLMEAAHQGHPVVVQLLIDHGADPSLRDTINGRTPLEMARNAAKGADPGVFELLKSMDYEPIESDLLADMDVSPETHELMKSMLAGMDIAESYRENANLLARVGDHEGVIRILAAFEDDPYGSPGSRS